MHMEPAIDSSAVVELVQQVESPRPTTRRSPSASRPGTWLAHLLTHCSGQADAPAGESSKMTTSSFWQPTILSPAR